MRTFHFPPGAGHRITAFGSHGATLSRVLHTGALHVAALYLRPGAVVGRHRAADVQLFLVIDGSGTVTGAEPAAVILVEPGTAVLWDRHEEHETHAGPDGLRAIILEGPALREG